MFARQSAVAAPPDLPPEAQRFLEALGLDGSLPQRLTRRPDGRPYEPLQLAQPQGAGAQSLVQELALLQQPRPAGGWEGLVESNRRQLAEACLAALAQRASEGVLAIPVRRFLMEVATLSDQAHQAVKGRLVGSGAPPR